MTDERSSNRRWIVITLALIGALVSPHLGTLVTKASTDERGNGADSVAAAIARGEGDRQALPRDAGANPATKGAEPSNDVPTNEEVLSEKLLILLRQTFDSDELPRRLPPRRVATAISRRLVPLVVALPDPWQSHMAIYYDEALVAVRQAAAQLGFVQSNFDLPWQSSTVADGRTSSSCRTNAQPGLMLFTRGPHDPLLVVIFVTESPVLGTSRTQLELTLWLAEQLQPVGKIALVGPFFSGTAQLWSEVLGRRQALLTSSDGVITKRFAVMTGSATARSVSADFERAEISFARSVHDDEALKEELLNQLRAGSDRLGTKGVVELRELGTAYGRGDVNDEDKDKRELYFFPLNISEVRAQSEADTTRRAALFPSLRRTLGLKLEPVRQPKPDIPASLSVLTPFVDDLALAQTLRRICDSRSRHAVISASDASDMIFLVQQSRKFCRDLVLVTLGYESLFVHPDLAPMMAGVLNVSAFAPSAETAELLGDSPPYPFANWVSQGVFSAFCRLGSGLVPTPSPPPCASPTAPRIVISEIAGARYWPLRISDVHPGDITAKLRADPNPTSRLPRNNTARLFAWPALFAAVAHLWMRFAQRGPFRLVEGSWREVWVVRTVIADLSMAAIVLLSVAPFWWLASLRKWDGGLPKAPEVIVVASFVVETLLVERALRTLGATPVWFAFRDVWQGAVRAVRRLHQCWTGRAGSSTRDRADQQFLRSCASVIALLGLGVLCLALLLAFGGMAWALVSTKVPSSGALAALHRLLVFDPDWSKGQVELRWFRSLEPFAMSSLMPFLYMAYAMYWWSSFALFRLRRLDRFPTDLSSELGPLATVPARTLKKLCEELAAPWSTTGYWGPLAAVWAFGVWRFWVRLNGTLEGDGFDLGFKLAFCAILLFVGAELVRFVTLSHVLLAFLRDLAAEPMIDAYDRLANKVAGSFGLQLSARAPEPDDFQISVLTARTLSNQVSASGASEDQERELEHSTVQLEHDMAQLNDDPASSALQRRVHTDLFKIAGSLHRLLVDCWKERAAAPLLDQATLDVTRKELLPLGLHAHSPTALVLMGAVAPERYLWLRTAEDFVALRTSTFIYQVLHELRHTLVFALIASALLAASSSCYPFVPARFLTMCVWSAVVIVVSIGLFRMIALERNEVLSRLGGTRPDRIEWNAAFVKQLALYVALPLVAALLGLFPGIAETLSVYLTPLLRLMPAAN